MIEKADPENPLGPSLEVPGIGFQASNIKQGTPEREAYDAAKAEREAQRAPKSATVALTFDQLQRLMSMVAKQNSEDNRAALVEAIKELKKPSEEEAAKLAEAKQRRKNFMDAMLESARAEEANKEFIRKACHHRKPNGIMNYQGQVHGEKNPQVVLICGTCHNEIVRRPATAADIQSGPLELLIENQRMGLNA